MIVSFPKIVIFAINLSDLPLFSIIIPTKNRLALLKQCIESLENQLFKDFEVLIVDDHSDDGTWDWLKSIENAQYRVFQNEGIERSSARNTALNHASGEWICFCDDDDLLAPSYFSDFYKAIQNYEGNLQATIFRTNFKYFGEDSRAGKGSVSYSEDKYKNPVRFLLEEFGGLTLMAIPKKVAKAQKFAIEFPHWQDTHYLLRLFYIEEVNLIQLNVKNYWYRIHQKMGSKKADTQEILAYRAKLNIAAMDDLMMHQQEKLKNFVPISLLDKVRQQKVLEYASIAFQKGYWSLGFSLINKSLKYGLHLGLWKYYAMCLLTLVKLK